MTLCFLLPSSLLRILTIYGILFSCRCSSVVELSPCKRVAVGSSPTIGFFLLQLLILCPMDILLLIVACWTQDPYIAESRATSYLHECLSSFASAVSRQAERPPRRHVFDARSFIVCSCMVKRQFRKDRRRKRCWLRRASWRSSSSLRRACQRGTSVKRSSALVTCCDLAMRTAKQ